MIISFSSFHGTRLKKLAYVLFGLIWIAGCTTYQGKIEGSRYTSPNREFSIALPASGFEPIAETVLPDRVFVDFTFKGNAAAYDTFGLQTVEWLILPRVISSAEFAENIEALAKEHVRKRFSSDGAQFSFEKGVLFRKTSQSEYHFFAEGRYRGKHASWEGVIVHLENRMAFVSYLTSFDSLSRDGHVAVMAGKISAGLEGWKDSLRAGQ